MRSHSEQTPTAYGDDASHALLLQEKEEIRVAPTPDSPIEAAILEVTRTFHPIYATSAYGRKQTFGLSLNECFLTAALEEKADIQAESL